MISPEILLVGAGPMAVEYAKVLKAMDLDPVVVGRGGDSARAFAEQTGIGVYQGGLEAWLASGPQRLPARAIIAVGEKWIGHAARLLIQGGVRQLLVEKPGGADADDIRSLHALASARQAGVFIGYNRRFYASVEAARNILLRDGGARSFTFEFTERSHVISTLEKESGVKEQWFLSNSTHLIDLAFYLGGRPETLSSFCSGGLDWHPAASRFFGAGQTGSGALFSYSADWEAPGRWKLELMTSKHRLIFCPLEKLQVQKIGGATADPVEVDDELDRRFKPGLYLQVEAFLDGGRPPLQPLTEQIEMLDWYLKMRGDGG